MKYLPEATGSGRTFVLTGEGVVIQQNTQTISLPPAMTEDEYQIVTDKVHKSLQEIRNINALTKPL